MKHVKADNLIKQRMSLLVLTCFIAIILLTVYGCSNLASDSGNEKIGVIVSILPQAEFAEKVGRDRINVTVMVPPGANPHTYEPTPGQLKEVSRAELYLKVGSGVEFELAWMDKIAEINRSINIVNCSEGISLIGKDPHIWLSVINAIIMVENIYEGLIEIDPGNKDFYYRNKNDYQQELSSLDDLINEILKDKKNRKIMVYHPAWTYFSDSYGLEQIPIEEEGKEPTMGGMKKILEQARQYNIKVIFASPEISAKSAEVIASEIGGSVILISPLEKDYINNMKSITEAFAESMQ
jgi:zinc transport system substrate-binding protein